MLTKSINKVISGQECFTVMQFRTAEFACAMKMAEGMHDAVSEVPARESETRSIADLLGEIMMMIEEDKERGAL